MCARAFAALVHPRGFGIVNEVYYPRVDIPQIRDLGFIIADGAGFWAEVKRVANYRIRLLAPGVPAVEVVHQHDRYSLRLRIAPDARMCWRSGPPVTATAPPWSCIGAAGHYGPSKGRSAPPGGS
jgi:hypothetical protein